MYLAGSAAIGWGIVWSGVGVMFAWIGVMPMKILGIIPDPCPPSQDCAYCKGQRRMDMLVCRQEMDGASQ